LQRGAGFLYKGALARLRQGTLSQLQMENEVKIDVEILPADAEIERVNLVPT
jgi:hypothetical protein